MPFKSARQRKFLYAKHPDVAARFAAEEKKSHKKRKPLKPRRKK